MRDGWTETTLGDVTTHFRGTIKVEDGFPYPAAGVMMEGRGLIDREPFVGGVSGYKKLTPIAPGQLVLRSITAWEAPITVVPVGYVGRHVSGVFPVLNLDKHRLEPEFMRLICQWPTFWNEMRMRATGSVLRRKTLSANQLQEIPMNLPPLVEQKRIVDVVSSVDAFIDALQQQADTARTARNALLHELLSAGGEDWTETTLGDIAEYINGYPFKPDDLGDNGIPVIRIKQLLDATEEVDRTNIEIPDKCVLMDGDIVFSWSGTLAVRVWNRGKAFLNQHLFRVIEKPGVSHDWLPLVIDHAIEELVEKSHGTTMKHITKQTLLPHEVLLPPLVEQKRIVDVVSSMDDVIQSTERAVADAKNLRSGLLSDLLSGEHEIPESYDVFVGAA